VGARHDAPSGTSSNYLVITCSMRGLLRLPLVIRPHILPLPYRNCWGGLNEQLGAILIQAPTGVKQHRRLQPAMDKQKGVGWPAWDSYLPHASSGTPQGTMYCVIGACMVQYKGAVSVVVLKLRCRQSSAADNVCVVHFGHCGQSTGACRCCARVLPLHMQLHDDTTMQLHDDTTCSFTMIP
jgi:hypothetical protein